MDGTTEFALPCGCRGYAVDGTFVFEGCSANCQYVLYVQAEAQRREIPLATLDMR